MPDTNPTLIESPCTCHVPELLCNPVKKLNFPSSLPLNSLTTYGCSLSWSIWYHITVPFLCMLFPKSIFKAALILSCSTGQMSTSPPTPPATITYPLVPAVSSSPQADVRPANASTAIVNRFLSSLPAVWKFFTTVCCEILQIILLATLALVTGNLFWHSVLLDAIVIISAVGYVVMNSVSV